MKKHLFPNVDCQERCDEFPRDALMNVVYRTSQHVAAARVTTDSGEVLKQVTRSWEARRSTRSRRCRKTVQEMDVEDKENICYSKHVFQSDVDTGRKCRHNMLPSPVEFHAVTCSIDHKDPPRRSSQSGKSFENVPLTGLSRRWLPGRGTDSVNATLTHSAYSREVRRDVVIEGRAADNDTSVWSAVSHNDDQGPRSTTEQAAVDCERSSPVLEPELSRICSSSPTDEQELREQTSSGELTGAFHSTFSYPLHSTLLTAAVTNLDVSSVPETVAEADAACHDLQQTASGDAPPIGCKSASMSAVAQDVRDVGHKDNKRNDFLFNHVAISEAGRIRTVSSKSQSSGQNTKPMLLRFSCYLEAGKLGGKTSARTMPYFPPLSTTVDVSTSSAAAAVAAANIITPLEQHYSVVDDDDALRTVLNSEGNRIHHIDTSLEAVRGSPCVTSHDPTVSSSGLEVASRMTLRQCRLDASSTNRPDHRTNNRREVCCAKSSSKSGGRGTSRMARETGRGDLRHTFNALQDVRCQSSLNSRDLFRVYPSHHGRTVDNRHCTSTRVYQRQHRCRQRPRRARCRCGVEVQNLVNFVDPRTGRSSRDTRRGVLLPPGESENKPTVKRSERYLNRVRKRTLVNRLKQFSGCFCDTGCGRRMRTLANV